MIRKIFLWLICFAVAVSLHAQAEKTILFLLPFHVDAKEAINPQKLKSEADIQAVKSFELIGFWEGAKMAIQEYDTPQFPLRIIARDIKSNDTTKLRNMLQNLENEHIDLIIGPLFFKPFMIAADFAKQHKIPIVNPFSTRADMLDNNPYVYKLTSSETAAPNAIVNVLKNKKNYNLILWGDTATLRKNDFFRTVFDDQHIDYQEVTTIHNVVELEKKMAKTKRNVVITFSQKENILLKNLQSLTLKDDTTITIVGPEEWITLQNVDLNLLNRLNFNYFSDYFVDYKNERMQLFMMNFINKNNVPPSLNRFSFQGYDITRYFLELLQHDFKTQSVDYQPLVMTFDLQKSKHNGYENQCTHLISISNFEPKSVK